MTGTLVPSRQRTLVTLAAGLTRGPGGVLDACRDEKIDQAASRAKDRADDAVDRVERPFADTQQQVEGAEAHVAARRRAARGRPRLMTGTKAAGGAPDLA